MKKIMFLVAGALFASADLLTGRRLATNSIGLPDGVDPDKVNARRAALIQAGTDPLLAGKLAIDAEAQQAIRDRKLAAGAAASGSSINKLTVTQLTELAEEKGVDLGGATKKADILAALRSAGVSAIALLASLCFAHSSAQAAPAPAMPLTSAPFAEFTQIDLAPAIEQTVHLALHAQPAAPLIVAAFAPEVIAWRNPLSVALLAFAALASIAAIVSKADLRRMHFLSALFLRRIADELRGRTLAFNVVMTPTQIRDGIASLDGTAAIATKNYAVVRGADDTHFKVASAATDVPLGILLNDELETDEIDVVKKPIALFGLYQGDLPGVAEAAIDVDALLVLGLGTPGRVKALPSTTPGTYWVIGRNRKTVASAGDPVSIIHCTPYQVTIGEVVETVAAANVITADETGKTFFLSSATEFASTLPAPQAGLRFTFIVAAAPSGASYTIATNSSANIIKGLVVSSDLNNASDADFETSGGDTISFVDGVAVAGDTVELISDGTNWFARGFCTAQGGITITTAS
jgi:hypothetical protein